MTRSFSVATSCNTSTNADVSELLPLTDDKDPLCVRLKRHACISQDNLNGKTTTDLKLLCKQRNLIQSGRKADLVQRLITNEKEVAGGRLLSNQAKRRKTVTGTTSRRQA